MEHSYTYMHVYGYTLDEVYTVPATYIKDIQTREDLQ